MYHDVSYDALHARRLRYALVTALLAFLVVCVGIGINAYMAAVRERGQAVMRDFVVNAALQCYVVEGAYPTSIDYLREHYGVPSAQDGYHISYEWLGDNIPPSVVVSYGD